MEPSADRMPLDLSVDGRAVALDVRPDATLLEVLREHLRITSVKDGCAPQGQCGCCTVLVDGAPRVACVTPASRVAGRAITTVDGLEPSVRDRLVDAFVAEGASQCGFCTPGILVRLAPLVAGGEAAASRVAIERALAAHLCRCTGWQPIITAAHRAAGADDASLARTMGAPTAHVRAGLETGGPQACGSDVVLGRAGFADDLALAAPDDALVAVPLCAPTAHVDAGRTVEAAGVRWVVTDSLAEARRAAGKVQGRRSTLPAQSPLLAHLPLCPPGGVRLATSWVEPAYLEPDASWCAPGGEPATPLANGGAFGAKATSVAPGAARDLADRFGRPVRVVLAREDVVRLGPKRPPVALAAFVERDRVVVDGVRASPAPSAAAPNPYGLTVDDRSTVVDTTLATAPMRAPWAETAIVVEAAVRAHDPDATARIVDDRAARVALDACIGSPEGAWAGARVVLDDARARIERVEVRLAAGEPLDGVVLRSYCTGAVHQALGWVLTEGLAVDDETGEIHDLTIRSFGIIRAKDVPPIDVTILADDDRPPLPHASDAVFAATAAAAWLAIGVDHDTWPALDTDLSRRLRR